MIVQPYEHPISEWKDIEGYHYHYRISDTAVVQRLRADGTWKTLTAYLTHKSLKRQGKPNRKTLGRMAVKLCVAPGDNRDVFLVDLMAKYYLGGRPKGMKITHKNGEITDCTLHNLVFMTPSDIGKKYGGATRRSVEKVAADGTVLELYRSVTEAAEKNFMQRRSVTWRCMGKIKAPINSAGDILRYEPGQHCAVMADKTKKAAVAAVAAGATECNVAEDAEVAGDD